MTSEQTERLSLPYIMASQAQKHVTHNEAIRMLDALVQMSFVTVGENEPPASPQSGACHVVGDDPVDLWSGHAREVAAWQDNAWAFLTPKRGWLGHSQAANRLIVFDGNLWIDVVSSPSELNDINALGINTSADHNNRLSVAAAGSLLTHEGAGHQLKINKNSASDTASVLFQTGWSGRAEFGLAGDDNWHVKVSSDGADWKEALIADGATGQIAFPNGLLNAASGQRPQGFLGVPGTAGSLFRIDRPHGQNPRTAVIADVTGDVVTLTTNDAELFMSLYMAGEAYARIWNITRSPDQHSAWVKTGAQLNNYTTSGGVTFTKTVTDQLVVTEASDLTGWQPGDIVQIGDPTSITPSRCVTYDISPMMMSRFGRVFRQSGILAKYFISGDTSVLTPLQTIAIGITPDGATGSFNNADSNNQGVGARGLLYTPCARQSPISESNLVSIRETGGADAIRGSAISVLGFLIDL